MKPSRSSSARHRRVCTHRISTTACGGIAHCPNYFRGGESNKFVILTGFAALNTGTTGTFGPTRHARDSVHALLVVALTHLLFCPPREERTTCSLSSSPRLLAASRCSGSPGAAPQTSASPPPPDFAATLTPSPTTSLTATTPSLIATAQKPTIDASYRVYPHLVGVAANFSELLA